MHMVVVQCGRIQDNKGAKPEVKAQETESAMELEAGEVWRPEGQRREQWRREVGEWDGTDGPDHILTGIVASMHFASTMQHISPFKSNNPCLLVAVKDGFKMTLQVVLQKLL